MSLKFREDAEGASGGEGLDGDGGESFSCRCEAHFEATGGADGRRDVFYVEGLGEVRALEGSRMEGVRAREYEAGFRPGRGSGIFGAQELGRAADDSTINEADGSGGEEAGDLGGGTGRDGVEIDVVEGSGSLNRVSLHRLGDSGCGSQGITGGDYGEDVIGLLG